MRRGKSDKNPASAKTNARPLEGVADSGAGDSAKAGARNLNHARMLVMAEVPYVRKRGDMKTYRFVRDTDVIAALRGPMMTHGLVLTGPHEIKSYRHESKPTSTGKPMNFATAEYLFRLEFVPTGEKSDIWVVGEGADSLDKGSNKSMSAARKYALILGFNLTSGDDPDQFDEEGRFAGGEHDEHEEERNEQAPPAQRAPSRTAAPKQAAPVQTDHGNKPAEPKPAKVLPENGAELEKRLKDYEARLVAQGYCAAGELVAFVVAAGVRAGYSQTLTDWSGPAIEFAAECAKEFDPAKIKAEREAEANREREAEAKALAAHEAARKAEQPAPQAAPQPQAAPGAKPSAEERYTSRLERMNACVTKANLDKFRELYTKDADMNAEQKKALEACYWHNVKRLEGAAK